MDWTNSTQTIKALPNSCALNMPPWELAGLRPYLTFIEPTSLSYLTDERCHYGISVSVMDSPD